MKIRLAKTAGFCMGVRRAVEMVLDIQRQASPLPIVTFGPLIHNPQTLQFLESRGIREVNSLDHIDGGTVIIRAHGISPNERLILERKAERLVDATCPRVAKVHAIIRKHTGAGDYCVIVGDADHPEVRGIMGFASNGSTALPQADSLGYLDAVVPDQRICVVAQTTQEVDTFERVVEALRRRYSHLSVYNTICDSTKKRQQEVIELARSVDTVVVVGGKGSGNTRRLVGVAQAHGVEAVHVETDDELMPFHLKNAETIGVTAGASTPNWQILAVIEKIKKIGLDRKSGLLNALRKMGDTIVMTYVWAALGGAGLTAACLVLQERSPSLLPLAVTMLFVFSMHLLNRIQDISGAARFNTPQIAAFYARHKTLLTSIAALSSVGSLALSVGMGTHAFLLLLCMVLMGGLYTSRVIPESRIPSLKWRSMKDLPGSKTPLVAAGWAMSAAVLPIIGQEEPILLPGLTVSFLFCAGMVFWRTALSDLMDIQGDRIVGRETIPILLGVSYTSKLLLILLAGIALLMGFSTAVGWTSEFGVLLIANSLVFALILKLYNSRRPVDRIRFEALIDGNFVLAGALAFAYGIFRTGT